MSGVVCRNCGASNREGLRFCENCDRFLGWDATSIGPAVGSAPGPQPAPTPAPVPPRPVVPPVRPTPVTPAGPGSSGPRHAASERSSVITPTSPRSTVRLLPVSAPPEARSTSTSTICPNCALDNDPARRFCARCGEWLVTPTASSGRPPMALREQWRRRWFGDRGPYSDRLSRATVGFRVLVTAVVAVLVTALLGVAQVHPIQRVKDQIGHVRGTGRVTGLTATAQPAGGRPDPTAAFAVDQVRARGWSTRWTATSSGVPESACRSVSAAPSGPASAPNGTTATSLVIDFPGAVDVREIGFEAGLVKPEERNDRWQPKTLELRWPNGGCQAVNLDNTADLQRFGVHQGAVGSVVITVVAGYPPVDSDSTRLDIGEVTLWRR